MEGAVLALHAGLDAVLLLQDGIIRRDQAMAAGLADSTVASKVYRKQWIRMLPRVYAVGVEHTAPTARVRATALWAGDDAVITGTAAAWWWGLLEDAPHSVTVVVPPKRRMSPIKGINVLRASLDELEVDQHRRLRVTSPAATCLYLARNGQPDLLESALRQGLGADLLDETLELGRHRRGQVGARRSRERVRDNPWSAPESSLHRLLRDSGITGWTANPRLQLADGARHPDVLFAEVKLIVEIDGTRYHRTPEQIANDLRRQNAFVDECYTILRFTPAEIADEPDRVVTLVRRTIERLSHSGAAGRAPFRDPDSSTTLSAPIGVSRHDAFLAD